MTVRTAVVVSIIIALAPSLWAQGRDRSAIPSDTAVVARLMQSDSLARAWYQRMITPGVRKDSTTFVFDEEVRELIADPVVRHTRLKTPFTWVDVKRSLEQGNLRFASWQLINLYPSDTARVLSVFLRYDEVIPADTLITAAYYTYALLDPRITRFENGSPVVHRPDILEDLFASMHHLVGRVVSTRTERINRRSR